MIQIGCFDLLLDAEKCKFGIEIQNTIGPGPFGATGMYFGAGATPSNLSPGRTPWLQHQTPAHPDFSPSGPRKCDLFDIILRVLYLNFNAEEETSIRFFLLSRIGLYIFFQSHSLISLILRIRLSQFSYRSEIVSK